jgi:rubrerythrin
MEKVSAFVEVKRARSEQTDPVIAVCEECGQSAEYPPEQSETIQNCPHCGAYVDVPDGVVEAESPFESGADDESEVDPS